MGEMKADVQLWIYIILGIIYLISRLRKKPQETSDFPEYGPENPVPQSQAGKGKKSEDTSRPVTFEELLREITEGKTLAVPEKKPAREPEIISYEDDLGEEERSLEKESYENRDDRIKSAYEEAKRQAFLRPSLEETMSLADTDMKFGRFKEFDKPVGKNLLHQYLADFNDPEGLKKAIVMSEILKRKF